MFLNIVLLIAGFFLLIKGADVFVKASVNIAKRLQIPSVVIGLTVVAIGTSAPEAVISATAAAKGSNALAIGNAIGSNMFNLLLIVGLCSVIRPMSVRYKEMARDFWVCSGAAVLLLIIAAVSGNYIPRLFSFLLFVLFVVYMVVLVRQTLKKREVVETVANNRGALMPASYEETNKEAAASMPLPRNIFLTILGCALIIAGGQFTVESVTDIAYQLGISERIIALTVVAVGTSLPELVVSVVACRKGEGDVALGNVVGSSIFNILLVVSVAGTINALPVNPGIIFDLIILSVGCLLVQLFAYTGQKVIRTEGAIMLLIYFGYMTFVVAAR